MTKLTMTVQDLAETLGISVSTVYNRRASDPKSIPTPLNIPGQRVLLWLQQDVVSWLVRFSSEPPVVFPEPKRRGRPRLSS
jgi:predicted DNA-binding transcriptional regulator AlpA